jgi:proteasome lid subunit RPN8/RPN11
MRKNSKASLWLSAQAWQTILLDAWRRGEIEACGALLGVVDAAGNWHIEQARPLRNIFASPVYFEFDPAELLSLDLEQAGRMVGVYHSHPHGPALASATDRGNMQRVNIEQQIPWVWLIVSGPLQALPDASTPEEMTISYRGVIAYHHYQEGGLQQIAIRHDGEAPIPSR